MKNKQKLDWTEKQAKACWKIYCKTHQLPKGIPSNPDVIYKNSGWKGWLDWIGSKNFSSCLFKE